MKVSGFTIVKNAIKLGYPVIESINSILPICDEFIVNVGDSEDGTLDLIRTIKNPKIKIIETKWDLSQKHKVLSEQTNIALKECKGDWAFYLQTDEVVHEADLPRILRCMQEVLDHAEIDALRFKWLHFYGSHFRYRIDQGWYQKQDRIIRNNGKIQSFGDAFAFERKDGKPLRTRNTDCFIYHYGWVYSSQQMAIRRINSGEIWQDDRSAEKRTGQYEFGDLNRFPVYFGTHPKVMKDIVENHLISQQDANNIRRRYWWNPLYFLKVRYKTGRRVRQSIA